MAQNNFKIFDQNKVNMQSDTDYTNNTQRLNGVQQGIASSSLNNKALYQASTMNAAIAGFMNDNGQDATDANLLTLKNNYSAALTNFSNNTNSVIESYPVKSGVTFSAGDPVDIINDEVTISKSENDGLLVLNNNYMDVIYQFDETYLYTAKDLTIYQYTLTDGVFHQSATFTVEQSAQEITSLCKYNNTTLFATVLMRSNEAGTIYYSKVLAFTVAANSITFTSESEEITHIASGGNFKMQPFVGGSVLMSQTGTGTATTTRVLTFSNNVPTSLSAANGSYPVLLNNNTVLATAEHSTTTTVRIIFNFYTVSSTGALTLAFRSNKGTVEAAKFENVISTSDDMLAVVSHRTPGNLYAVNYDTWAMTAGATVPADPLLYQYTTCYPTTARTVLYRNASNVPFALHEMTFTTGVNYSDAIANNFTNISPYSYFDGISSATYFGTASKKYALFNYRSGSNILGFSQTAKISASTSQDAIAMQDSTTSPCKVCFAGAVTIPGVSENLSVITPGVSMQTYTGGKCIIYNSNAVPYQLHDFTGDGSGQISINVGHVYKFIIEADSGKVVLGTGSTLYTPTNNENGTKYVYIVFR